MYAFYFRKESDLTYEDLALLCDLFYLPFEHGGQGLQLLQEFNWLKSNAHLVIASNQKDDQSSPEVKEMYFSNLQNYMVKTCIVYNAGRKFLQV